MWKICKDTNVSAAKDKVDKIYCEGEEIDNEEVNKDEISMLTFFIVIQDQELEIRSKDRELLLSSGTIFIPTVSYSAPAVGVSPVSIVHISLASIKN